MKEYTIKLTKEQIKHIYEALSFSMTVDTCTNWPYDSNDDTKKLDVMLNINNQINNEVKLTNSNVYIYTNNVNMWENKNVNKTLIEEFDIKVKND